MMNYKAILLACSITALSILPSLSAEGLISTTSVLLRKPAVGAPGPVAGVGLAFLAVGGGYLVYRSRKQKAK
jgi:hypothetical protein